MAAWALNAKERFLRQDIHDKRNFFGAFSFIQSIQLILSNKRLNGAKLFLWTTLQNNVYHKAGGIQYARNKLAGEVLIFAGNRIMATLPAITVFAFKTNKRYDHYNKQLTKI